MKNIKVRWGGREVKGKREREVTPVGCPGGTPERGCLRGPRDGERGGRVLCRESISGDLVGAQVAGTGRRGAGTVRIEPMRVSKFMNEGPQAQHFVMDSRMKSPLEGVEQESGMFCL